MTVREAEEGSHPQGWAVRGLLLPTTLVTLLEQGLWRHPGAKRLQDVIPWFRDPLMFPGTLDRMRFENESMDLFADDAPLSQLFRVTRGSRADRAVDLPWLDAERAVFIAVNRDPGADVALALDYRTDLADPRVVASDFWTTPSQCSWRLVAPTFTHFLTVLHLNRPGAAALGGTLG
ncbi:hypothetical protein O3597_11775 [Verrucosispora sp. WMMA2044]|uniref:hypothetical protein n=1 Tax=Verrucosispora sp. WMMA2044 TaxID=3016419 RepID=UPI00248BAADB|nr:hypothetical protein [Verrucosispora sp. WMMA2044]WBB51098.1 hypothetical protein O3597_11775 [Verrucosispora sp. WMMA2044]